MHGLRRRQGQERRHDLVVGRAPAHSCWSCSPTTEHRIPSHPPPTSKTVSTLDYETGLLAHATETCRFRQFGIGLPRPPASTSRNFNFKETLNFPTLGSRRRSMIRLHSVARGCMNTPVRANPGGARAACADNMRVGTQQPAQTARQGVSDIMQFVTACLRVAPALPGDPAVRARKLYLPASPALRERPEVWARRRALPANLVSMRAAGPLCAPPALRVSTTATQMGALHARNAPRESGRSRQHSNARPATRVRVRLGSRPQGLLFFVWLFAV